MTTNELIKLVEFARANVHIRAEDCIGYVFGKKHENIIEGIINKVSFFYEIPTYDLIENPSRTDKLIHPRHVLFYILVEYVRNNRGLSLNEAASKVEKTHASLLSAHKKIQGFLTYDKKLAEEIAILMFNP